MGRPKAIYVVYKYGEYFGEGTIEELAKMAGVKESTLRYGCYPSIRKRNHKWRTEPVKQFYDPHEVDLKRIEQLKQEHNQTYDELAELLGIKYANNLVRKVSGHIRFRVSEIRELEDLYFLEEGALVK